MTRKTFLQFNSFWKLHAWDNATNSTSSQSCVAAQAEHVNFCQLSNRAPPNTTHLAYRILVRYPDSALWDRLHA